MAKDLQDVAKKGLSKALKEVTSNLPELVSDGSSDDHGLSRTQGIAAGAGIAAALPLAMKAGGKLLSGLTSDFGQKAGSSLGEKISDKVDEAGGPAGILKDALPFSGDDDDDDGQDGAPGVGKGRRMPVQQSVDIGVPVETVYNQWTQFELWPNFMHRVTRVSQEDPCTVSFETKIWGKTKEFTAKIKTQRPDERVHWEVSQGMNHTGVVTFHELGPRLTRVLLDMNVEPGGMIEKLARGARYVKRAARADLHRFKAFIETSEQETGAWRGVIEDGEVVEDHDEKYDRKRDYADPEELFQSSDEDQEDSDDSDDSEGSEDSGESEDSEGEEQPQAEEHQEDSEDEEQPEAEEERPQRSRGRERSRSSSRGSSRGRSGSSRSRAGSSSGSSRSSGGSRSSRRQASH